MSPAEGSERAAVVRALFTARIERIVLLALLVAVGWVGKRFVDRHFEHMTVVEDAIKKTAGAIEAMTISNEKGREQGVAAVVSEIDRCCPPRARTR